MKERACVSMDAVLADKSKKLRVIGKCIKKGMAIWLDFATGTVEHVVYTARFQIAFPFLFDRILINKPTITIHLLY